MKKQYAIYEPVKHATAFGDDLKKWAVVEIINVDDAGTAEVVELETGKKYFISNDCLNYFDGGVW